MAIDLAAGLLKKSENEVGGIIIESTFTSIPAVVRGMKYGWVPGIGLVVTQPFDSATKIGKVETPLLIIHGTAAAASKVKRVIKIEGGTHSGASRVGGTTYRDAVLDFVRRSSQRSATATPG